MPIFMLSQLSYAFSFLHIFFFVYVSDVANRCALSTPGNITDVSVFVSVCVCVP